MLNDIAIIAASGELPLHVANFLENPHSAQESLKSNKIKNYKIFLSLKCFACSLIISFGLNAEFN